MSSLSASNASDNWKRLEAMLIPKDKDGKSTMTWGDLDDEEFENTTQSSQQIVEKISAGSSGSTSSTSNSSSGRPAQMSSYEIYLADIAEESESDSPSEQGSDSHEDYYLPIRFGRTLNRRHGNMRRRARGRLAEFQSEGMQTDDNIDTADPKNTLVIKKTTNKPHRAFTLFASEGTHSNPKIGTTTQTGSSNAGDHKPGSGVPPISAPKDLTSFSTGLKPTAKTFKLAESPLMTGQLSTLFEDPTKEGTPHAKAQMNLMSIYQLQKAVNPMAKTFRPRKAPLPAIPLSTLFEEQTTVNGPHPTPQETVPLASPPARTIVAMENEKGTW